MVKLLQIIFRCVYVFIVSYLLEVTECFYKIFNGLRDIYRKGKKYELHLYYSVRRAEYNFRLCLRWKTKYFVNLRHLIHIPIIGNEYGFISVGKEEEKMVSKDERTILTEKVVANLNLMNEIGSETFMKGKFGRNLIEIIDNILNFYKNPTACVEDIAVGPLSKRISVMGKVKLLKHTEKTLKVANVLLPLMKEYIMINKLNEIDLNVLNHILRSLNEFLYSGIAYDFLIRGKEGGVFKVIRDRIADKIMMYGFESLLKGKEIVYKVWKTLSKVINKKEEKFNDCRTLDMSLYNHRIKKNLPKMINVFENKDMFILWLNSVTFVTNDTRYIKGVEQKLTNSELVKFLIPMMRKYSLTFADIANENVLYVLPRENNAEDYILRSYGFRDEFMKLAINKRVARFSKIVNGKTFHVSFDDDTVIVNSFPNVYKHLEGKEGVLYIDKEWMERKGLKNGDKMMKYGKSLLHGIKDLKKDHGIDVIFTDDENKLSISLDLMKKLGLYIWSFRAIDASKEEEDAASIWALLSLGVIDTLPEKNLKRVEVIKNMMEKFFKGEIVELLKFISFKKDEEIQEDNVIKALESGNYTTTLLQVIEKKLIDKLRKIYINFRRDKLMARVMPLEILYLDGGNRDSRNIEYGEGLIIRYPCHHFIYGQYVYDRDNNIIYINSELWMKFTGGDFDGDLAHVFPYKNISQVRDVNNTSSATNFIYDFRNKDDRETLAKYMKTVVPEKVEPKADFYDNLEIGFINVLENQKNIGEAFRMAMIFRQMISYFYGEEGAMKAGLVLNTTLVQRAIDSIKHNDNFKKQCIMKEFDNFIKLLGLPKELINKEIYKDFFKNKYNMKIFLLKSIPYINCDISKVNITYLIEKDPILFWTIYMFSWFNKIISLSTKEIRIKPILRFDSSLCNGEGLFRIVKNLRRDLLNIGFEMHNYIKNTTKNIFDDVVLIDKEDKDPLYETSYVDVEQNGVITRYEVQFMIKDGNKLFIKKDNSFFMLMKILSRRNLVSVKTLTGTYILANVKEALGIKKIEISNAKFAEAFEKIRFSKENIKYGKVIYTMSGVKYELTSELPDFYKSAMFTLVEKNPIKIAQKIHYRIQTDMKFKHVSEDVIKKLTIQYVKDELEAGRTIAEIEAEVDNL